MPIGLQRMLDEVTAEILAEAGRIEAEADAKDGDAAPGPFGIAVATPDGARFAAGAAGRPFPLQSIAKVFALDLALAALGDDVFERVGREPSGDAFNSIVDLERNEGIPRNPFINAGALVTDDILIDAGTETVVDFVSRQVGRAVVLDDAVIASEQSSGDLNRAMLSFARHHGNLRSGIDAVMAFYIRQCAILLDCAGLAQAGLYLAETTRRRDDPALDATAKRHRRILALMMTCGHYDGSGDFAYRVGLPAKSGVGGGILAIVPEVASIAVWSPNLDQHGNSILGVHALERLSDLTGWSVLGTARDA